jgi:hypothetical protein
MVDRLSEQFARHEAFLETGRTQAREQVEIVEMGDIADEGCRSREKAFNSPMTGLQFLAPVYLN